MTAARFRDGHYTVEDGLRLHFRDYPGPVERLPLLCLHGLTRNARDFADLAERFSPDRRVIAADFRGRGESDYDPQPERYVPLTYAHDIIRLMDHLGFAEAIIVGTSLGGLVAMAIAALEPERIAATVLNDIGPELDATGLSRIRDYLAGQKWFASLDEAGQAIEAYNRGIPASLGREDWAAIAARLCRPDDGGFALDFDPAIATPFEKSGAAPSVDLWPLFNALAQKPVLVLRGEHSDLLSAASAERMRAVSPNVSAAIVSGAGHTPDLSEPEAIAAIDAFVASVPETVAVE